MAVARGDKFFNKTAFGDRPRAVVLNMGVLTNGGGGWEEITI